jgi:hypothetical protein
MYLEIFLYDDWVEDSMELDKKTEHEILELVEPIIKSVAVGAAVATLASVISALIVTNYKSSSLTGDTEMHPTKNDTAINKTEASAKDNDASLAKDEVKAKDGDLSAAQTDAKAMTTDAKAMDSGASAAQPKAGALDVKTKGMVMS